MEFNNPENIVTIELPASKSISNRLLLLRKISNNKIEIVNNSLANDSCLLRDILSKQPLDSTINCHDAGTVYRFMTCLCAAQQNKVFKLTGTERLMSRPNKPLVECLTKLGASLKFESVENKTILNISGTRLKSAELEIPGNISSQFISGLCLISPLIQGGLSLKIKSPIYSKPYINLTLKILSSVGIESTFTNNYIRIEQQEIVPRRITVEQDWSAASFFYAFMILNPASSPICINGLNPNDLQGDKIIIEIANHFGIKSTFVENGLIITHEEVVENTVTIDLSNYPDLAIPIIVACAFKHPKVKFSGLAHLRDKESDRLCAIQHNLENFGIIVNTDNGSVHVQESDLVSKNETIKIKTFSDHRIAMSFSLLASLGYNIKIDDVDCIHKSFPDFQRQVLKLGIDLKNSII